MVSGASLAGGSPRAVAGEISPVDGGTRVLVVFFSQGNSAKRVAEDIATLLGADVGRVVEKNERKWGSFGSVAAGAASTFGRASPIDPPLRNPAEHVAVVEGSCGDGTFDPVGASLAEAASTAVRRG